MAEVAPTAADTASGDIQNDSHDEDGRVNDESSVDRPEDGLPDIQMEVEEGDAPEDRIVIDVTTTDDTGNGGAEPMSQDSDDADPDAEADGEGVAVSSEEGKRVKVYELRDQSWFDRGTGHCRGVYDDSQDVALLIVEPEDQGAEKGEADEGPGGFLKDELLLSTKVEKEDIYARQQDTLIVWTEPTTNLDIALSFQDGDGCEDIWQFICEVQKHLNNLPSETDQAAVPSSSSPLSVSPMLGVQGIAAASQEGRTPWQAPTLANIREHLQLLRMQSRSPQGRERAVEHILAEDYIKQLITVFDQAEDLESVEDLHTLCTLMQAIIMFNDNGILEYILQDGVFLGVIGILEYDPEFPSLKASFRQFFQEIAKFRQVIEIRDATIRNKIHQTYRLQYLKEVVLARLLDDPTFGILNGFIFFNQVDIIAYFQSNPAILWDLLDVYKGDSATNPAKEERQKDTVAFLHQLMLMGKTTQVPTRLALYRNLLNKGLLIALEWALKRDEPTIFHAGAEMLTLMAEHDANAVRNNVMEEENENRATLVKDMIGVMGSTANLGLLSQIADTLKTLMEIPAETEGFAAQKADGRVNERFLTYVYEQCFSSLFKPLLDLPDMKAKADGSLTLTRSKAALLGHLVELLSFCITVHSHRASLYIMSNSIARKTVSLLYFKEKPLRHAALRFVKACFRTNNHFLNRHFVKSDLLLPVIMLMEEESLKDNMLCSACMDILEILRKDTSGKAVITYLFESHPARLQALSERPFFRAPLQALHAKYEQWSQPPPPPPAVDAESSSARTTHEKEKQEDDYFNGSDDEYEAVAAKPPGEIKFKKKRSTLGDAGAGTGGYPKRSPKKAKGSPSPTSTPKTPSLGLDYEDASDSEGSTGPSSPRAGPSTGGQVSLAPTEEMAEDLGDVAMKMRQKRQREEDEEEGFAGLLLKANAAGGGNVAKSPLATAPASDPAETSDTPPMSSSSGGASPGRWSLRKDKDKDKDKGAEKKESPSPKSKEEGGKKIRLNLGVKRLSGYLLNGGNSESGQDKK